MDYYLSVFLARSGIAARRKAIEIIKNGNVTVNNIIITDPKTRVHDNDIVMINNKKITLPIFRYIICNKPRGYITAVSDIRNKTVCDLITIKEKVFPIGRLDKDTSGILLLTNDGEFAQKLMHPKYEIKKEYIATLDKPLIKTDFQKIIEGIILVDGFMKVDDLYYKNKNNQLEIGILLHSGKNRIIRRIFAHLGYTVTHLDRIRYATLDKNDLGIGKYRDLTKHELNELQNNQF